MNRLVASLITVILLAASTIGGSDTINRFPDNYSIRDIIITVISVSDWGHGTTTVVLDGKGKISLEREVDGEVVEKASKELAPKCFLVYLRDLYTMNFFNFESEYPNTYRTITLDGDTIRYNGTEQIGDLGTLIMHCQLGAYEKRVVIRRKYPCDLWDIGNRIQLDARTILNLPLPHNE
jgi:hypothetical protein